MREFLLPNQGEAYLNSWQKRAVDVVGTALIAPLIIPPMLLAAAAIKLEDKGDVLFSHQRVGKERKPFDLYKLLRTKSPQFSLS